MSCKEHSAHFFSSRWSYSEWKHIKQNFLAEYCTSTAVDCVLARSLLSFLQWILGTAYNNSYPRQLVYNYTWCVFLYRLRLIWSL